MLRFLLDLLRMAGADNLRRIGSGLSLFLVGALVLGVAAGFGALAAYQSLLLRLEPWAAASLTCGALVLTGGGVCWLGSKRLRGRSRSRVPQGALPALDALAPLLGLSKRKDVSPLQMVAIAAVVGFALGRGR
jgi:hypothetical protein